MKRIVILAASTAAIALVLTANAVTQTQPIRTAEVVSVKKVKKVEVSAQQQRQLQQLNRKIATLRTETWQCQDEINVSRTKTSTSVWALPRSVTYRSWVLDKWTTHKKSCKDALQENKRQWNWQAFPSWIIKLAVCETGGSGGARPGEPNWYAEGSSSHGTFYSAFNISRSVYDRDAHHMGVRGWNEGPGVPSPYEQAMAVIGHVRLYGDGFTGRCHGIARSSW